MDCKFSAGTLAVELWSDVIGEWRVLFLEFTHIDSGVLMLIGKRKTAS